MGHPGVTQVFYDDDSTSGKTSSWLPFLRAMKFQMHQLCQSPGTLQEKLRCTESTVWLMPRKPKPLSNVHATNTSQTDTNSELNPIRMIRGEKKSQTNNLIKDEEMSISKAYTIDLEKAGWKTGGIEGGCFLPWKGSFQYAPNKQSGKTESTWHQQENKTRCLHTWADAAHTFTCSKDDAIQMCSRRQVGALRVLTSPFSASLCILL